jgi:glycosyltransferase involved in cell wall biosynthesis
MTGATLIVVSNHFLTFVRDQTVELAPNFDKVKVYVVIPKAPRFLLRFNRFSSLNQRNHFDGKGLPGNIEVKFIRHWKMPSPSMVKGSLDKAADAIAKDIGVGCGAGSIIHAHFAWPSGHVAMKLSKALGIPYVVTVHGYDIYDLPLRNDTYKRAISDVLSCSGHTIAVSAGLKGLIRSNLRLELKSVSVVPNGFDPRVFHPSDKNAARKRLGIESDKKLVLCVAALMKEKDLATLVKSAALLKQREDVLFALVGDGPERGTLEAAVKRYGLSKTFIMAGMRPHDEIPVWMNAADIFTLSSAIEGVPTVLFEAMACGLPYVGTNVGGIPEIVTDASLGLLVGANDSARLSAAYKEALEKSWDRDGFASNALRYTWQANVSAILNVYRSVVGNTDAN